MKRVLLFSGGMDSVAAWELLCRPERVYVRIGAPYETRELNSLAHRGLLPEHLLDSGRWLGGHADKAGRVPLRNLLFAVAAAAATGADEVVLGATAGETSPDKSRAFARAATRAMTEAEGRPVRLLLPFRHVTKKGLVARLLALAGRDDGTAMLQASPSCYVPWPAAGTVGCGRCTSCLRRWVAMSLNGIHESYEAPPWQQPRGGPAQWWPYLRRTPPSDWLGVARLNHELLVALRRQQQGAR